MGWVQTLVVGLAISALGANAASADDVTARRLRPWVTPEDNWDQPQLATGIEGTIDGAAGAALSTFTHAPVIVETGALGWYFASSGRSAWSVEAIEKLDVAIDSTTPQFGLVGAGLRRLGQQHLSGIRALNFQRVSVGLALLSRGTNLVTGVGAELAGGTMNLCGSGFAIHVDGYFFARPDAPGTDEIVAISLGYVYSPKLGIHGHALARAAEPPQPPMVEPLTPALEQELDGKPCDEIARVLNVHRRGSVEACNAARDDAARVDDCNRETNSVLALRAKVEACRGP